MSDLLDYVEGNELAVAPDSPGRILRALRKKGTLDYFVVDRGSSLYQVVSA